MAETLILRQARSKTILAVFGSLAFVAIGLWMIADPDSSPRRSPEWVLFWGWACALFFGFTAASGAYGLVEPTELQLSAAGFQVRGSKARPLVPWTAVEGFFITEVRGAKFVSYELTPEWAGRPRGWASLLPSPGRTHKALPSYLEQSPDQICDLMESWRLRYGAAR